MKIDEFIKWLTRRQNTGYIDIHLDVCDKTGRFCQGLHYQDTVENVLKKFSLYAKAFCVKDDIVKNINATYVMFYNF